MLRSNQRILAIFMKQKLNSIIEDFQRVDNIKDMFAVVQDAVRFTLNESRAGLDLDFMELGNSDKQLLSAFYPIGSNRIIVNKTPLRRLMHTKPELMKPYVFSILLHEYIHSLGYLDEATTRTLTCKICYNIFGKDIVTEIACDMKKYMPYLMYPGGHPAYDKIEIIELEDLGYIG